MNNKKIIKIILGSTRQGRQSDIIGVFLQKMVQQRPGVQVDILDLRDYNIPFLYEAISPMARKEITDPAIQKWADAVSEADAFIIISPEYNAGYSGVLKNALDVLYKEWNDKSVAFVGYSGGPNGGCNAITHLRLVAKELRMRVTSTEILIPKIYNAFDIKGQLRNVTQEVVDRLIFELIG